MRVRSSRCSMWKEMLELRAPEKSLTGIEIRPNVRYPDQTDDAIVPSRIADTAELGQRREFRLHSSLGCSPPSRVIESESTSGGGSNAVTQHIGGVGTKSQIQG